MPDSLRLAPLVPADLLQFHMLTAFPPHNVNRDEDGRPKTCLLGGSLRGRISSQAKKRALRFAPHFPKTQRATRTREAGILAFRRLSAAGIDDALAAWAALAVNMAVGGGTAVPTLAEAETLLGGTKKGKGRKAVEPADDEGAPKPRDEIERSLRSEQGLVVSTRELARLDDALESLIAAWQQNANGFASTLAGWVRTVCKEKLLTRADHDLDTALFGRMVAADPAFTVEAACAVSHAFTTHSFVTEGDYFSAGEELNELGGTGAAITSYAFFGGGVYYQHAVLDRAHLRQTLADGRSAEEAERLVVDAMDHFLTGLLFAQPKGKRNSHASDVAASYVLVTRGGDPALNLGLAFLDPVTPTAGQDLMQASIARLTAFHEAARAAYGLTNALCAFNAYPAARAGNAPQAPEVWTVEALHRFVLEAAGQEVLA
ncbi:type I-E CRISPR-associated protein Cas7/Cse4/CasC [Azospirillum sp. A1-3]|uniref:type I-E CRISPR-associated protein Cas7/Cse4/CasC n=1 Tax=Azospirillum sp. A1-3 TaxID=185874 RepID=UPI0020775F04|nr:type I-E CRISPR-associated protein Cas7/Cse4/CasC [Azospirillum sp. A1-3]MCM8738628.1 type I-E CRISPR-associated protein Cas7/Cse4/CasC [Azospirillum sp. A1-3]